MTDLEFRNLKKEWEKEFEEFYTDEFFQADEPFTYGSERYYEVLEDYYAMKYWEVISELC